jgi:hypothetical protein
MYFRNAGLSKEYFIEAPARILSDVGEESDERIYLQRLYVGRTTRNQHCTL